MPLTSVDALSDDDEDPGKGSGQVSASAASLAATTPAKSAPEAKPSAKKRPASAIAPSKPMKRPAAAPGSAVLKKPAASDAAVQPESGDAAEVQDKASPIKANKYMYRKLQKWGIKVNGKEKMTACLAKLQIPMPCRPLSCRFHLVLPCFS